MTKVYRLATAATTTGATAGTANVVASGRIVGSKIHIAGTGGAGIGRITAEVTVNQNGSSFAETNMPVREPLVNSCTVMYPNAGGATSLGPYVPHNMPIKQGNVLNINLTQTGTAPASQIVVAEVFVEE